MEWTEAAVVTWKRSHVMTSGPAHGGRVKDRLHGSGLRSERLSQFSWRSFTIRSFRAIFIEDVFGRNERLKRVLVFVIEVK